MRDTPPPRPLVMSSSPRPQRRHRERLGGETGMSFVFVAVGFMAFLSATMLAVDVGMVMVARSEAQNSADAGALAGAVALVFDDFTNRSASGPAVQNALVASQANQVMSANVSVTPTDVTFPTQEQIRVQVHRTSARGNAVPTMVASVFGMNTFDLDAFATAQVSPANAATCIKPWAIPDKWIEMQTPAWDETDSFDMFYEHGPNQGDPLPDPDVYVPADQPGYTGYQQSVQGPDYGRQVRLKVGNPQLAIDPSHFFPIALDGGTGGSWYESNITACWPGTAVLGDMVAVEPGNMVGPTAHGTQLLIDKDPGAYWDGALNRVVSSQSPSARIVVLPVFDPVVYETGRQSGRTDIQIANLVGFFIEGLQGNDVLGRVVPMTGLIRGTGGGGGGVPGGSYLRAIQLVE